jgi:two-component system sensor histidine kinase KdpD
VEELLQAGISVSTSVNLEYIDDQQAFVRDLVGRTTTESVPHSFIAAADEVVVVDAPSEADTSERAHQLSLLRQRALLLTADVVDRQLESYLALHNVNVSWGTQERIMVCMTPRANAASMLASGRRNADRFHGELYAVYVNQPDLTPEDRTRIERNVMLAGAQAATLVILDGKDPIQVILDYARGHGITQLFVGHNLRQTWRTRLTGTLLDRLIHDADGMDVRVFPH